MWECEWWPIYKTDASVKQHSRESFPFNRSLSEEQLLEKKLFSSFGYIHRDNHVPEHLRKSLTNFLPITEKFIVCRHNIGPSKEDYIARNRLFSQTRRMLISSFKLQKGFAITSLLLVLLEKGLVCTKITRFVQYTPVKSLNEFFAICRWRSTARKLKPQFQCCCRNNDFGCG